MVENKREVIRIAVTGHRILDTNHHLTASIQKVLTQIIQDHPGAEYHLLSALAEGSDQFIAMSALQYMEIKLIVPLPLPEELYLLDFETDEGRKKFVHFMNIADQVLTLTKNSDHDTAYDYLGTYLIDQCHVLIALWNGEYSGKRGGTGEVVKKALNAGKPVYWIYFDNLRDGASNSLRQLKKSGEIQVLGSNRDN
ncbi:MAG: hypothetical protein A2032_01850 [Chloroflexi bacterium RBG_19FT_COMBO_49_13]|nr:MAG: hypothetical protein A2Y53_08150 [Chloroflexi bacterium RBG_16_47_49]OGO60552.1 MAG: hypothetical protein A2032_01850 [Chloroflexi bacterium RBG_19FT_COMBO_49_13]